MFRFIKKTFLVRSTILANLMDVNSLSCISMTNKECKAKPEVNNVNSNEPVFYHFSIKISKCSGSCNNINDPYEKNVCS